MNAPQPLSWTDANQRLLAAELARIKHRLAADSDDAHIGIDLELARAAMPSPAAIDRITACFGLSAFERDVLLVCAGVVLDAKLARLCADAMGDLYRQGPTFGLALAALTEPHWSALAPIRPLRRWRLIELDDGAPVTDARLAIDERILHHLAGVDYLDTRLAGVLRPVEPVRAMAQAHRAASDAIAQALARANGHAPPVVALAGDDASGQIDVAAETAAALDRRLYAVRAEDVPVAHAEREAFATLWAREAALADAALIVTCAASPLPAAAARFVEDAGSIVFVSAAEPQGFERETLRCTIDKPDALEQKRLWREALGAAAPSVNGALDAVASQFRLSARPIALEGARIARSLPNAQSSNVLWTACRGLARCRLDELAQRIDVRADWDALVLPDAQKDTLRQIASHVRHRLKVHLEWGFADAGSRGLGITALFAGESGTGKTMAAEVLARELELDLYRVDLSAVVSKYVGETEKNLRRVFDAAEESGTVLLFDEADALFGKRSEVKDSHDRYANIEVSYLLQRMEAYRGLAILTTNLKPALDVAFQRRLRFIVHFPFPDQATRETIWRRAFPSRTPVAALDHAKLARLNVTGGHIRNIAINAAFAAAQAGEPLSMTHLLHAAHHEAAKRERPLADAETRGWV